MNQTQSVLTAYRAWKSGGPFSDLEASLEDLSRGVAATPKPLTTAQAARIAGISVRTLAKLCDSGDIVCWKLPKGDRRIEVAELRRWMGRVGMALDRLDAHLGRM